jgi:hypothetical protein
MATRTWKCAKEKFESFWAWCLFFGYFLWTSKRSSFVPLKNNHTMDKESIAPGRELPVGIKSNHPGLKATLP